MYVCVCAFVTINIILLISHDCCMLTCINFTLTLCPFKLTDINRDMSAATTTQKQGLRKEEKNLLYLIA